MRTVDIHEAETQLSRLIELAAKGDLETFKIGSKRYVVLDSLRTLPERMRLASSKPQRGGR